ncbi:MAG: hypothetical protein IJF84_10045 [Thermoguttaceae bacterium]|nr:hypothetical protein [Thermoguttaceae bacterium]
MFDHTVESYETLDQKTRLVAALNYVCAARPYLSGLASLLKIYVSNYVDTAGISATGRLLINPNFLEKQNLQDLAFILAHELMHLVLQTHEREGNFSNHDLVNVAHDFIINDDLMEDFATSRNPRPPAGALYWPDYEDAVKDWKPAGEYSLEELVSVLRKQNISPEQAWDNIRTYTFSSSDQTLSGGGGGGSLGDLLKEAGVKSSGLNKNKSRKDPKSQPDNSAGAPQKNKQSPAPMRKRIKNRLDVISEEDELSVFPDQSPESLTREQMSVQQAAIRSYSEAVMIDSLKKIENASSERGDEYGNGYGMIELLRGSYVTPWEAALQRWFDSVTPGDRSFARASRRGAWRTDVVLPGRKREGWTIHIVLDTSGSMTSSLRSALGAIDNFCQNNNVETIHILQCDVGVTADEWLEVGTLEHFEAKGFGGSDMTPAMLKLAEDPDVTAVIVLTDGYIGYPEQEPPYETLWAIVDRGNTDFNYGTAILIETDD